MREIKNVGLGRLQCPGPLVPEYRRVSWRGKPGLYASVRRSDFILRAVGSQ